MRSPVLPILLWACLAGRVLAEPTPDYVRKNALQISSTGILTPDVYSKIKGYKIITVGEMHGTNEVPAFVHSLLRLIADNGRSVFLALEIPSREQAAIDSFLKTGDAEILKNSAFFSRDFQDGRSSQAMAGLLAAVRAIPGLDVVCFDPYLAADSQERDVKMARNISEAFSKRGKDVAVVLAGNVHSSIEKGVPWDKDYRPMGYELHRGPGAVFSKAEILAILSRFESGSAWNCTSDRCGATSQGLNANAYANAVSWGSYFLKETELSRGYNATFFSRTISASIPLKQAKAVSDRVQ